MEANIYQETYNIRGEDSDGLVPEQTRTIIVSYAFDGSAIEHVTFYDAGGGFTGEEPRTPDDKKKVVGLLKKLSSKVSV